MLMNPGDVKIRPAQVADASAIVACVADAYHHYINRIGKPPAPMLDDYREVVRCHRVLLLTDLRQIVGVLVLIRKTESLLLDNVAVRPSCQGRGLGRKLMALAEAEARRLGLNAIELYTNEHMTENIEFYKSLGYMETGRKTEKGYRRVYMRKELEVNIL